VNDGKRKVIENTLVVNTRYKIYKLFILYCERICIYLISRTRLLQMLHSVNRDNDGMV
jgi:hypothetical protein